jgi:hypothetical protein
MADDKPPETLEELRGKMAEIIRHQAISAHRRGHLIRRLVDATGPVESEATRDVIARDREERLAVDHSLLEPYRLSLLARHIPFDDWADDPGELARQTVEATAAELCELAQRDYISPRLLLLLDSYERLIAHFAGVNPSG